MGFRGLRVGLLALFCCLLSVCARGQTAAEQVPAGHNTAKETHDLYDALNALRADPAAVYNVRQIELRRADVRLSFEEGTLAFFAPLNGRVTGAVFSGIGHVLSTPRDPVERQQLARFVGAAVLDAQFQWAYLRFTDDTAADLLRQVRQAQFTAVQAPDFLARWNNELAQLNPPHSLRIMLDWVSDKTIPYFYAEMNSPELDTFEMTLDARRDEPLLIGQARESRGVTYYDAWTSSRPADFASPGPAFRAERYSIEATVLPDFSLEGAETLTVRTAREGERMIVVELSNALSVDSAQDSAGRELAFFEQEGLNKRERNRRGNFALAVVLPEAPRRGEEFAIRLRYRGRVISDAGNGVVYVGEHGAWYPRLGGSETFADYDLALRWPRKLRLVATGTKIGEVEDGDFRVGHWRTEKPISVAGFNLGEYRSISLTEGPYTVEVFAHRQLEEALSSRLAPSSSLGPVRNARGRLVLPPADSMGIHSSAPSPADALQHLAKEVAASILFFETYSGPFPLRQLNVSQIPGTTEQSWPGLLYVSTLSFLPASAQQRAGLSEAIREHFSDLAPFHEVAHQWWGDVVGWRSYRDQWLNEAIANYLGLLFADSRKVPEHTLRDWLVRYRAQLLTKQPDQDVPPAEFGPLSLGNRLVNSKSPDGYERVIYSKGTWVIHMLRMLLRQPGAKIPDARFVELLRTLSSKYAYRPLTTDDLQREVEAVMTPAMDIDGGRSMEWFFEDWVRGTGVPHYKVEYSVRQSENGVQVRGKLLQEGVPHGFAAPVPLWAETAPGRRVFLGTVIASGEETPFRFAASAAPRKLLID
ncbi:MAG TPA: M1 family aminopeptidase, partial [Methylomirabilota bacterium]|nr:M1 family aminopeptidase [Methylomirabilota bacterium]